MAEKPVTQQYPVLFVSCERVQPIPDDNVIFFELKDEQGNLLQIPMSIQCFMRMFTAGWQQAAKLPPIALTPEDRMEVLQTTLSVQSVRGQPALVLVAGPLSLILPVTREQIEFLLTLSAQGPTDGRPH